MRFFLLEDGRWIGSSKQDEPMWEALPGREVTKEEYDSVVNPSPEEEKDEDVLSRKAGKILLELSKEESSAFMLGKLKQLVEETLIKEKEIP